MRVAPPSHILDLKMCVVSDEDVNKFKLACFTGANTKARSSSYGQFVEQECVEVNTHPTQSFAFFSQILKSSVQERERPL